ncbi:MAG: CCDC90 family protein [Pseudomonadota bacterium]|nr:CCDC90 family protein [Pseudomonadota bacterium]
MTSVTFDTLKFVEKLKASGMPDVEAKAIAEAFRDAQSDAELGTKKDLRHYVKLKSSQRTPDG